MGEIPKFHLYHSYSDFVAWKILRFRNFLQKRYGRNFGQSMGERRDRQKEQESDLQTDIGFDVW